MASYDEALRTVTKAFKDFGYNASQEEILQFLPIATTREKGAERANASVATYVKAVRDQQERRKNDPLNQVIADERGFFTETEKRAADYKTQLEGPVKLFGGLDQTQIDQYLAPTSRAAAESSARLEGAASRRGISGSSTELQTLADNERKYREDVLSSGLTVGLDERNRISQLLMQQYGLLPGSLQRQAGIAGQQSADQFDETRYNTELPTYLRGISAQENAIDEAIRAREESAKRARTAGIGRLLGTGLGAVAGGFVGGPIGVGIGAQLGQSVGGGLFGDTSAAPGADILSLASLYNSSRTPATPRRSNFIGGNSYTLDPAIATG